MKNVMKWARYAALTVFGLVLLAGFLVFVGVAQSPWKAAAASNDPPSSSAPAGIKLVPDMPHTLMVPETVRKGLSIRQGQTEMIAVARPPRQSQALVLPGSTALDPDPPVPYSRPLCPGARRGNRPGRGPGRHREGRQDRLPRAAPGDQVKKGDLLGIFYSVDVGNKKNDLIDALCQLRLDEEILEKAEKAFCTGALPEVFLLNAAAQRRGRPQRRTPRRQHAQDLGHSPGRHPGGLRRGRGDRQAQGQARPGQGQALAPRRAAGPRRRHDRRAQLAQHEMVVDDTVNLFQIAKVDRLLVLANVPEDDLPTLQALEARPEMERAHPAAKPAR